jgi:hypothetical protein
LAAAGARTAAAPFEKMLALGVREALAGGPAMLFSGNAARAMRALPTGAVCTTCFLNLLVQSSPDGNPLAVDALPRYLCAAGAVTVANIVTCPIDAVKGQMGPSKTGVLTAIVSAGKGGPAALFPGLGPALRGGMPVAAMEMMAIDVVLKAGLDNGYSFGPGILLFSGATAAVATQSVMHPLSILRARASATGAEGTLKPFVAAIAQMSASPEGVTGTLYKGLGSATARSIPAVAANSLVRVGLVTTFLARRDEGKSSTDS